MAPPAEDASVDVGAPASGSRPCKYTSSGDQSNDEHTDHTRPWSARQTPHVRHAASVHKTEAPPARCEDQSANTTVREDFQVLFTSHKASTFSSVWLLPHLFR